jgi:hypothetical protein
MLRDRKVILSRVGMRQHGSNLAHVFVCAMIDFLVARKFASDMQITAVRIGHERGVEIRALQCQVKHCPAEAVSVSPNSSTLRLSALVNALSAVSAAHCSAPTPIEFRLFLAAVP